MTHELQAGAAFSPPAPADRFDPPPGLRHPMLQSILASKAPVRARWRRRGSAMQANARALLLDGGDGVRLCGWWSPQAQAAHGLAVLIHGWEGSHDSAYLYSMACALHLGGWSVLRLNLRDHGDSHALNEELFHSARIAEVLHAIADAQRLEWARTLAVIGFSLGGNFALRVALHGPAMGLKPALCLGICPAIDPGSAMAAIDGGPSLFRRYFLTRWRRSVLAKARAWPERRDYGRLLPEGSIAESTRRFVAAHTPFARYEDYLAAYTLTPAMLVSAPAPVAVITAQDDPIIPFADFAGLRAQGSVVAFEAPALGGHCGFIENWQLDRWAESRALRLLGALRSLG